MRKRDKLGWLNMGKPNIVLDMSQLDLFLLCEARFNYRYNLLKEAPRHEASPLDRGTLIHTGCETYYKALQKQESYETAVSEALESIKRVSAENELIEPELTAQIINTLEEYFDYWRFEDQLNTIDAVETPFINKVDENDTFVLYLTGKIDLVVTNTKYTKLPMDHKSFERERETYRLSNQFMNYCNALGSNYIVVNKIGLQKTLKPEAKYKRVPLSYDPLIIEQWRQNIIKVAYRYINCVAEDSWLMNFTSCDKYNRRCEYYELCDSSGEEARVYKLHTNFQDAAKWDVSEALRISK